MSGFTRELGRCIRETGQALNRLGMRAQGDFSYREKFCRHRQIMNLAEKRPYVATDAWVAPNAAVIGDVQVGDRSSIWYGCVLRGDRNQIRIGAMTNLQDRAVVHTAGALESGFPATATIGNYVTVGQGAVLYSCTVMDEVSIGAGAILEEGSLIESHTIVEPGAVVRAGARIPSGQVWGGNPAQYIRDVTEDEVLNFQKEATDATKLANAHSYEFLPYGTAYLQADEIKGQGGPM